jgi:hypothetical protein
MHRAHLFTVASLALMVAACGSDDDEAGWQGETPHVDISGELDGNDVDLSVDGAAAADVTRSFCKREYIVPDAEDMATWSQAVLSELEATVRITDGGVEKEYELSLAGADLSTLAKGTTLTVVPAPDDGAPAAGQVVVEMEWGWEEPGTGFVSYEGSAVSGTVKVELFEGTPGADGKIIPDNTGRVGLTLDTTFDGGTLRGSFTLACAENEIEAE